MKALLSNAAFLAILPLIHGRHPKKGHHRRRLASVLFVFGLAPVALAFCSEHKSPQKKEVRLSGIAFGTSYHVTIRGTLRKGDSEKNIQKKLHELIERLDASMSNWRPGSTINKLNKARPYHSVPVDKDFRQVFVRAKFLYQKTRRYFDPASAALFGLWNFRTDTDHQHIHTVPQSSLPSRQEVRRALLGSGMKQFVLTKQGIYRKNAIARLNFSALAKGYLVDQMFLLLQKLGYPETLVEVGGEVRVGTPETGRKWKIGIEEPHYDRRRSLLFIANLQNHAMATSGDYRNYFRIKDDPSQKIYSHIINPRTGQPKDTLLVSATVIGPECMTSDALATTLLLLPPKEGLRLLGRFAGYEALLLEKTADTKSKGKSSEESFGEAQNPPSSSTKENLQKDSSKPREDTIKKIRLHAKQHGLKAYMSSGMPAFLKPF